MTVKPTPPPKEDEKNRGKMNTYHFNLLLLLMKHDREALELFSNLFICLSGKLFPEEKDKLIEIHNATRNHLADPGFLAEAFNFGIEQADEEEKEELNASVSNFIAQFTLEKLGTPKEMAKDLTQIVKDVAGKIADEEDLRKAEKN